MKLPAAERAAGHGAAAAAAAADTVELAAVGACERGYGAMGQRGRRWQCKPAERAEVGGLIAGSLHKQGSRVAQQNKYSLGHVLGCELPDEWSFLL
eukprot:scaffold64552_cov19-Tisochrysis_lutea.AAC.1